MASGDIVHCPVCAQLVAVTKLGRVWTHRPDGQRKHGADPCSGSKSRVTRDQIVGVRLPARDLHDASTGAVKS